jgi:hypothetical protein
VTDLILVLLASAWLVLLAPATLRARRSAPLSTAARFRSRMKLIGPARKAGRWVLTPGSPTASDRSARRAHSRSQQRRTQLLIVLAALVPLTLLAALARGGALWWAHGGAAVALGAYILLLLDAKRRRAESMDVVERLARRRDDNSFVDFLDERHA